MQGIFTYIPEKNYAPREYSVTAILLLLFMVLLSLVSALNLFYFDISTFRSMCAVPNMAAFVVYYYYYYYYYCTHLACSKSITSGRVFPDTKPHTLIRGRCD